MRFRLILSSARSDERPRVVLRRLAGARRHAQTKPKLAREIGPAALKLLLLPDRAGRVQPGRQPPEDSALRRGGDSLDRTRPALVSLVTQPSVTP